MAIIAGVAIVLAATVYVVVRPGDPMSSVGGGLQGSTAGDASGPGEMDVTFSANDGVTLAGTLTVPEDHEQPAPAVVIVSDFGATDRDGVVGTPGDPVYADLAEELARQGMVVLRYDKRGVGDSEPAPEGQPLTFQHRVDDAEAALDYLSDRAEVDGQRMALVGHGVGGIAGMRLASNGAGLSGLVLIGTAGRPYVEVVTEAYRDVGDEEHDEQARKVEAAVEELLATGELPEIEDADMGVNQILPQGRDAYLAGLYSARPTADAADVASPTLIVHGERDPDINRDTDVEPLRQALSQSPRVNVLLRPEAGHTLNLVSEDHQDPGMSGSQGHPVERDEQALEEIGQWLAARFDGG